MEKKLLLEGLDYEIFGAEGKSKDIVPKLKEISQRIIVFDADWVLGRVHIKFALFHARRAFEKKIHKVNTFENCVLLYVGLSSQIYEARRNAGVKPETRRFAIVSPRDIEKVRILNVLDLEEREEVIQFSEAKARRVFSQEELEATPIVKWQYLVLERMALLNLP
ncbi:MAG: KEOPS complex subunit Cgi121 [Thermoplasmata archaeon]